MLLVLPTEYGQIHATFLGYEKSLSMYFVFERGALEHKLEGAQMWLDNFNIVNQI